VHRFLLLDLTLPQTLPQHLPSQRTGHVPSATNSLPLYWRAINVPRARFSLFIDNSCGSYSEIRARGQ